MSHQKSELERLLDYFQSEAEQIDVLQSIDPSQIPGLSYISMITYEGVPILPPVMTPLRREEMLMYKRQAIMAESRIRALARQKLLQKVQSVMEEMEKRHGKKSPDLRESADTLDPGTSTATERLFTNPSESVSSESEWDVAALQSVEKAAASDVIERVEVLAGSVYQNTDSGLCSNEVTSTLLEVQTESVTESSKQTTPRDFESLRSNTESEKGESTDSVQQFDDNGIHIYAGEGLLLRKKQVEEHPQDMFESQSHEIAESHLIVSSESRISMSQKSEECDIITVKSPENDVFNSTDYENMDNYGANTHKGHTLTKRLPTFLRIQESLTRKLNSSSVSQSSTGTESMQSTLKSIPNMNTGTLGGTGIVQVSEHEPNENEDIMQKLASMTTNQAISVDKPKLVDICFKRTDTGSGVLEQQQEVYLESSSQSEIRTPAEPLESDICMDYQTEISESNSNIVTHGETTGFQLQLVSNTVEGNRTPPTVDSINTAEGIVRTADGVYTGEGSRASEGIVRTADGVVGPEEPLVAAEGGVGTVPGSHTAEGIVETATVVDSVESIFETAAIVETAEGIFERATVVNTEDGTVETTIVRDTAEGIVETATVIDRIEGVVGTAALVDTAEGTVGRAPTVDTTEGVVATATSTSASLTSGNTFGSDEMNKTVISQEESKSRNTTTETGESEHSTASEILDHTPLKQTGLSFKPSHIDSQGEDQPHSPPYGDHNEEHKHPLLSKVALNVDLTPFSTPHKGKTEFFFAEPSPVTFVNRIPTENTSEFEHVDPFKTADLIPMEQAASPGPSRTPTLSTISFVDSEDPIDQQGFVTDQIHVKALTEMHIMSSELNLNSLEIPYSMADPFMKSADTQELYTQSTELAQYMVASLDTIQSSMSTLPHGDDRKMPDNFIASIELNVQTPTPDANQQMESDVEISPKLRGSYTLDHPSPALVAAHPQDIAETERLSHTYSDVKEKATKTEVQLTSSMEDLKIRPVHRRLDYDFEKRVTSTTKTEELIITPLPPENESDNPQMQGHSQGQSFQTQVNVHDQIQNHSLDIGGHVHGHAFERNVPFDVLAQDQREAERTGKEEHLQRYLNNLSQMPSVAASKVAQQNHMAGTLDSLQHYSAAVEFEPDVDPGDESQDGFLSDSQRVLQRQHEQFEAERHDLLEEQREQLVHLMQEQDRQQRLFQEMNVQKHRHSKTQAKRPQSQQSYKRTELLRPDSSQSLPPPRPDNRQSLPPPRPDNRQSLPPPRPDNRQSVPPPRPDNRQSVPQPRPDNRQSLPPTVNQNQLLASLTQLLNAQALGGSLTADLTQGRSQYGAMQADPASMNGPGFPGAIQGHQFNTMHGYPNFQNTIQDMAHGYAHSSVQSQMSHSEQSITVSQNAEDPFITRPDSQMSSASTVTSRNTYNRTNDGTLTSQSIYSTQRDGAISQRSTLEPDYIQRPYSAPVLPVNYSMDGGVHNASPAGPSGVYYSPSVIAKLLSEAGLNISFHDQSERSAAHSKQPIESRDDVCKSPAVLKTNNNKITSPPQPLQSVFISQQNNNANVSINSSDKSVHFASPVQVKAYEYTAEEYRHVNGDNNRRYTHNISMYDHDLPYELYQKFSKLTALIKGYLVRRLLKTEKVQSIIRSISDTAEFALKFQQETPIKRGVYSEQDRRLQERVLTQLNANMYDIHDIFFELSAKDRMEILQQDRQAQHEKMFKLQTLQTEKKISAATVKCMGRKQKAMLAEASVPPERRPKSAPPPTTGLRRTTAGDSGSIRRHYQFLFDRALKPLQARTSPIKPLKSTNRVQHIDPNMKCTIPRKTHVQFRPSNSSINKTKSKQSVTSTGAKKTSQSAKQPVRKIARRTSMQAVVQ